MTTMRAARFHHPNEPLRMEEVPIPGPGPGEVLVEVKACGICGSDVHILKGETLPGKTPIILGHEGAGVISKVGEGVKKWKPGDRVVIDCVTTCGSCEMCLSGKDAICINRRLVGIHLDGALAQYVKVNCRNIISLPDEIEFAQGCIATDAVATPYHALKTRGKLQVGESLAVFGVGGLGYHAIKLARLMGASPIVAIDISQKALDRAFEAGADHAIQAELEEPPQAIRKVVGALGVDIAVECVGRQQTVRWAAESIKPPGRVTVIGLGPELVQVMALTEFVRGEVTLLGCSAFGIQEIETILNLARTGRLDLGSSITRVIPLNEVNVALRELADEPGNVIRSVVTSF